MTRDQRICRGLERGLWWSSRGSVGATWGSRVRGCLLQSRRDLAKILEQVKALAPDRIRVDAKRTHPCLRLFAQGLDLFPRALKTVRSLRACVGEDPVSLLSRHRDVLVGLGLCAIRCVARVDDDTHGFGLRR